MVWTPPFWLRKLDLVWGEHARSPRREMSPDERFRLACELMAFGLNSLRRQAEEDGRTIGEVLFRYEQATDWLRSRAS